MNREGRLRAALKQPARSGLQQPWFTMPGAIAVPVAAQSENHRRESVPGMPPVFGL